MLYRSARLRTGPAQAGIAIQKQHTEARAIQTIRDNGLLDGFRNPLPERDFLHVPQAANPLREEATFPAQNIRPADGEVLGDEVIGNAIGGAEDDAGAFANTGRYFNGSSNGFENDVLCG